jgi:alkylation response protein AidB-like acyl-CoA dehydrogenase
MQLVLTEDQELIAKTAADFVAERSPVSRFRALRDSADDVGFSRELWKEMAELGWLGIPFAESAGGAGMGMAELVLVLEAMGRTLAPEPFLSCVALAGEVLARCGSEAQQEAWLVPLIAGEKLVALAYQEQGSRYDVRKVAATADRSGEGWQLTGRKVQGGSFGGAKGRTHVPQLVDMYVDGKIDLDGFVSHRLTLDDVNKGFELMEQQDGIRSVIEF